MQYLQVRICWVASSYVVYFDVFSSLLIKTLCVYVCRALDLVNVHLFHDASNLIACNSSPSVYSKNRKTALRYVISRFVPVVL